MSRFPTPMAAMAAVFSVVVGCTAGAQPVGTLLAPDATSSSDATVGSDAPLFDDATAPALDDASDASAPFVPECPPPPPPPACPSPTITSLSGTVYDPAGHTPLSNAVVFVPRNPSLPLPTIQPGTNSCPQCGIPIGGYSAVAYPDPNGHFRMMLEQQSPMPIPPSGSLPVVIQSGKWRRAIVANGLKPCVDNPIDPSLTRLPRNQSEGDMPQIAVLTSGCDDLACLLRRIGIDASEFSAPHAGGRVDVYRGVGGARLSADAGDAAAGDCTDRACALWATKAELEAYDTVLLGCECGENVQTKPATSLEALRQWLDEGGQVIATHSQETWFKNGDPEFARVATWTQGPPSGAPGPFATATSRAFQGAFQGWLESVDAARNDGTLLVDPSQVSTSILQPIPPSVAWVSESAASVLIDGSLVPTEGTKLLAFPTPVLADAGTFNPGCGHVFVSDIHVSGDGVSTPAEVPGGCATGDLSAAEKLFEYLVIQPPIVCPSGSIPPPPPPPGCR